MSISRDLAQHLRYYQDLGVEGLSRDLHWRRREGERKPAQTEASEAVPSTPPAAAPQSPVIPLTDASAADRLVVIRAELGDCTRCKLHAGRTNLVFGVGNPDADLMFVGEGPGADEDEQGEPFVGRAGQLLTQIIKAMGFARDDVYIANVVKCRPPNNRNPEPDEIAQCSPFLNAQIASIKPKVIVALGKFAAQTMLGTEMPISRLRGRFHEMGENVVMPTFHPSYLLRTPAAKREVWEDMKMVMQRLKE